LIDWIKKMQEWPTIAARSGIGSWGYIVGTCDKDAGPNDQRLYLNGARVAQMSDSRLAQFQSLWHRPPRDRRRRPVKQSFDEFRIAHVQRSDGWIETTWNNMSEPRASAVAAPEEHKLVSRRRSQAQVLSSAWWAEGGTGKDSSAVVRGRPTHERGCGYCSRSWPIYNWRGQRETRSGSRN
jgi:hypothetical protein